MLIFKRIRKKLPLIITLCLLSVVAFKFFYKKNRNFNLLLITVDALRPDHLGCYGYKNNTSPNIDKLAASGTLFRNTISHSSWTAPSLASLMTSNLPSSHGIFEWENIISEKLVTFPEILKKNGYFNYLINAHDNTLFEIMGLSQAFDGWTTHKTTLRAEEVNEIALAFLKKNFQKKFFLWLHYMDVHEYSFTRNGKINFKTEEDKNRYFIKYDEGIKTVDQKISEIIKELKFHKIYDNTLIIFTSDHGEELCEHNVCFSHGNNLWDTIIKVPLILIYPGEKFQNKKIDEQVEQVDLAPTILDILNLKNSETFKGRTVLPLIKGGKIDSKPAISEFINYKEYRQGEKSCFTAVSLRERKWKMIFNCKDEKRSYSLFDLLKDPNETTDISMKEKAVYLNYKSKIDGWITTQENNIKIKTKELDSLVKERLKSLGYAE